MPSCPHCHALAEDGARFCDECGARLKPENVATAPAVAPPPAAHPESPWTLEVESNRPMIHGHALALRFRVTWNPPSECQVTLRMKLHGRKRYVEQDDDEIEQRFVLHGRGDQHIVRFPFQSLRPGNVAVEQLRVILSPSHQPGAVAGAMAYELPDRSLHVGDVAEPTAVQSGPGVVISGGIHVSSHDEVYASDFKDVINLNVRQDAERVGSSIEWRPIRLEPITASRLPGALRLPLPGGAFLDLVRIRAGDFAMGSAEGQGKDDERPAAGSKNRP